jgi:hypothetical protein
MGLLRVIFGGVAVAGVAVFGGVQAYDDETTRDEDGHITTSGGLGAFVVRVGDCVQVPDEERVVSLEGVPCDAPHDGEAYAKFDLPGARDYDEGAVEARSFEGCLDRWGAAIGSVYEQDLSLDLSTLSPSPESWAVGDRSVVCLVVPMDGSPLRGSRTR